MSLHLAAFILSLVPFASFTWAVPAHFRKAGAMPWGMRCLSLVSLLAYASFLVLLSIGDARKEPASMAIGCLAFMGSTMLFWWAVATTRDRRLNLAHTAVAPGFVQRQGPYAWIRHPFYGAYILFWAGTALAAGAWQVVPAAVLVLWYVMVARGEERRFADSAMAGPYAAYRAHTGMLLPRLRLAPMSAQRRR